VPAGACRPAEAVQGWAFGELRCRTGFRIFRLHLRRKLAQELEADAKNWNGFFDQIPRPNSIATSRHLSAVEDLSTLNPQESGLRPPIALERLGFVTVFRHRSEGERREPRPDWSEDKPATAFRPFGTKMARRIVGRTGSKGRPPCKRVGRTINRFQPDGLRESRGKMRRMIGLSAEGSRMAGLSLGCGSQVLGKSIGRISGQRYEAFGRRGHTSGWC